MVSWFVFEKIALLFGVLEQAPRATIVPSDEVALAAGLVNKIQRKFLYNVHLATSSNVHLLVRTHG